MRFDDAELGGEQMVVAALSSGPFFLRHEQHDMLKMFVCGRQMPDVPKLAVLVGPIKSGKSSVLFNVLPGMIAAHHAAAGGPIPVIFRFTFPLSHSPSQAATALVREASRFAAALGFPIGSPVDPDDALYCLGSFMGRLSLGIAKRGGELCLLLDEVQVRARAAVVLFNLATT